MQCFVNCLGICSTYMNSPGICSSLDGTCCKFDPRSSGGTGTDHPLGTPSLWSRAQHTDTLYTWHYNINVKDNILHGLQSLPNSH